MLVVCALFVNSPFLVFLDCFCRTFTSYLAVQGLEKGIDYKKVLKAFKKDFCCNGTVVEDTELGQVCMCKLAPKALCTIYAKHLMFLNSVIYAGHPVARGPAQKRVHFFGGQQDLQEGSSQDSWFLIACSSDKQPLIPAAPGKLWRW